MNTKGDSQKSYNSPSLRVWGTVSDLTATGRTREVAYDGIWVGSVFPFEEKEE